MENIVAPEGNVRMEIPDREIFELSESIKEIGLIHAILVAEKDGKFEVVAGQRRWLAAKKLGWKKITAEIRTLTRLQIALIRANENLQREGLSPIEEAAVYADLFDNHGLTIKMVADRMGKSQHHIKARMDLLQMDIEVQKAIHAKKITPAVARELTKITEKKDLYRYLEIAVDNGVTAAVAALWVDEFRKGLQYINDRSLRADPLTEKPREEKYFTMCQTCENPMEYKDMRTIKVCDPCFNLILKVVDQGYFKEKEK